MKKRCYKNVKGSVPRNLVNFKTCTLVYLVSNKNKQRKINRANLHGFMNRNEKP